MNWYVKKRTRSQSRTEWDIKVPRPLYETRESWNQGDNIDAQATLSHFRQKVNNANCERFN